MWWNQKKILNEDLLDPKPTLPVRSPGLITPLPANIFPNRLTPNVPNNILRYSPFYSLASFLIVSLTPSNNIPESSRDLTILKISFILSFEIIKVVLRPDPFFLFFPASAADAAAVKPNGIKTL